MSRMYVLQSWNNAAQYSGEQIGDRLSSSQNLFLPNGKANISIFADEPAKPKKKSVADSIDLANRHYSRMEKMSQELDSEYFAGEIDEERYQLLRAKMDERLAKAWKRLEKENGPIWDKIDEAYEQEESNKKSFEENVLTGEEHWLILTLNSLSEDNIFKKAYKMVNKIILAVQTIRGIFK